MLKLINNLIEFTKCPIPDITFLLDISVDEGFKRKTNDTKDRIGGSVASSLYLIMQGVQILRIHDVNELLQGVKVFQELIKNK